MTECLDITQRIKDILEGLYDDLPRTILNSSSIINSVLAQEVIFTELIKEAFIKGEAQFCTLEVLMGFNKEETYTLLNSILEAILRPEDYIGCDENGDELPYYLETDEVLNMTLREIVAKLL